MGVSGQKGAIYILPYNCPINLGGGKPPGTILDNLMHEQITKFNIEPSIYEKRTGHDKSHGATDSFLGVKSWDATIEFIHDPASRRLRGAGTLFYLYMYPFGHECGTPIHGYATLIKPSYSIVQEDGQPVTGTITVHNKGLWLGFDNDGLPWGGFECDCGGHGSGSVWA